jgi:hypothetical protein
MPTPGAFEFEPFVELPENAFNAARIFLAVMAYPERGAGAPGGLGVSFAAALWQYLVWNGRQARGLHYIRERFGDPTFRPPEKREFEGALNRGLRRLRRRSAAYSLVGTQMINGFFAASRDAQRLLDEGRRDEVTAAAPGAKVAPFRPELWRRVTRSPKGTIKVNVERWAERFGLNQTGSAADKDRKAKDLVRRAYLQSRPVLHMAHGFNRIVEEVGPKLDGWDDWDWVLVLLWNPDAWVWEAAKHASVWRQLSRHHFTPDLEPSHMIELVPPKSREIMHPAWRESPLA